MSSREARRVVGLRESRLHGFFKSRTTATRARIEGCVLVVRGVGIGRYEIELLLEGRRVARGLDWANVPLAPGRELRWARLLRPPSPGNQKQRPATCRPHCYLRCSALHGAKLRIQPVAAGLELADGRVFDRGLRVLLELADDLVVLLAGLVDGDLPRT